ncbi:patched family protein, partial [Cooperia oncophora]
LIYFVQETTLNLFRISNDGVFSDLIDVHLFGDEIAKTPANGVDDAFILIHRWRHRSDVADLSTRLTKVIVDVGPSITITSLTNIIAFGVGFLTPTPQMSLFCLATSVALLIDYIITYTILAPIVYLCSGKNDYQSALPSKPSGNDYLGRYSRLLCSLNGRLICGVFLITIYTISAIGVYKMKSTFEPAKAFPSDSPLVRSLKSIRPIFDTYFPVHIYVNHPPNISDEEQVTEMTRSLFMAPQTDYKPSLHNLQFWLDKMGNPPSVKYVKSNHSGGEGYLKAFSFIILGKGMAEWANRAHFVHDIRQVLADNSRWNASLFDGDSAVLALILTVSSQHIKTGVLFLDEDPSCLDSPSIAHLRLCSSSIEFKFQLH